MSTEQTLSQHSIIVATILIQIVLLFILTVATLMVNATVTAIDRSNQLDYKRNRSGILSPFFIIVCLFLSITPLIFSESQNLEWSPVFENIKFSLSNQAALLVAFMSNLIVVSILIWNTGGSEKSPFVSILFTIPSLAIFLRLDASTFIGCAVFSGFSYILLLYFNNRGNAPSGKQPFVFVNIFCLILSIATGFFSRPTPINFL